MKPLHSKTKMLSKCKCCQSKYNKGSKKNGKSAARQAYKRDMTKE